LKEGASMSKDTECGEIEIAVDRERCAGWGYCADIAPETFDLVGNFVALKENRGADDPSRVQAAARACPTRAIRVRLSGGSA
jgi:ferredoxin